MLIKCFINQQMNQLCICILVEKACSGRGGGGWKASARENQKRREQAISKRALAANKCRTKETICIQIKVYHLSLPLPVVHL